MDPISHAALGRSLVALASAQLVPGCVTASVLGSLSPDLDSIVMPFGWDRYLRVHEIGTHTVVGTIGCGLLVAAAVRAFARRSAFTALALAAWAGAASHVLLDLLSSARLRPLWPFADVVVSLPLVAMADPYLFLLCIAGPVAIWMARRRPAGSAFGVLALVAAFLLVKTLLGTIAVASYRTARDLHGEPTHARVIEAKWASLGEWHVFDRTSTALRQWRVRGGRAAELLLQWPLAADAPLVERSRSVSTVRNFLHVHQLAFATTLPHPDGGARVLWSDIRFCWNAAAPGLPAVERLACALWFGAELDAQGRPIQEIVTLGGFTQSRAPAF
jgi:membrane-bound metal-dependent hydrolase YbcI (DUF457 family)